MIFLIFSALKALKRRKCRIFLRVQARRFQIDFHLADQPSPSVGPHTCGPLPLKAKTFGERGQMNRLSLQAGEETAAKQTLEMNIHRRERGHRERDRIEHKDAESAALRGLPLQCGHAPFPGKTGVLRCRGDRIPCGPSPSRAGTTGERGPVCHRSPRTRRGIPGVQGSCIQERAPFLPRGGSGGSRPCENGSFEYTPPSQ